MIVNSKGASIAVAISAILSTHVFAADPTVEAFEAALKIDGAEYAKAYNLSNEEGFQLSEMAGRSKRRYPNAWR